MGEIIERTVRLKIDREICERDFKGIFDEERGVCTVKIIEDTDKPNEVRLVKLKPETWEI